MGNKTTITAPIPTWSWQSIVRATFFVVPGRPDKNIFTIKDVLPSSLGLVETNHILVRVELYREILKSDEEQERAQELLG